MLVNCRGNRRARLALVAALLAVIGAAAVPPAAGARKPSVPVVLPNLTPLAPEEVLGPVTGRLEFGWITNPIPVLVEGCFPEETVRSGARRCLRFDTHIGNVGEGPLEVAYVIRGTRTRALQHLYLEDGTFRVREATASDFHPSHAHFHIEDFYVSRLWATEDGDVVGSEPVATTTKNGFCPEDTDAYGSDSPPHYQCMLDNRTEGGPHQIVGISSGYMDTYGYSLPDQYVEITGVDNGGYILQITLDPNDDFVESSETDNSICVGITLEDDEVMSTWEDPSCAETFPGSED